MPSVAGMHTCIVGGGIHGTTLLQRLLADTHLDRDDVVVVDPADRLLASFRRKADACQMPAMRSTYVQHVGTEPFGLETFAESRGRDDELHPTPGYPRRPSLSLFLDYADYCIERRSLTACHRQATVEGICASGGHDDGLVVETTTGPIRAEQCILAIGHGGRYRWPEWAIGVDGVDHVWDGFDPDATAGETIVVGGGISAGQLAAGLAEQEQVTLLSRSELTEATIEADPRWINWSYIERQLHRHPPGSQTRYETVRSAHNDGTIPPTVRDRLDTAVAEGRLSIRHAEVESARTVDGRVRLLCDSEYLSAERVVLATGFEPVSEHPFVDRVASALGLDRGYRGVPILDDKTLAWKRRDGTRSPVFVSGALAAETVGPFSGTVVGARRSADRITTVVAEPSPIRA